jgi:hypothetical protein
MFSAVTLPVTKAIVALSIAAPRNCSHGLRRRRPMGNGLPLDRHVNRGLMTPILPETAVIAMNAAKLEQIGASGVSIS